MRILWCEEHAQAEDGEGMCARGRNWYGNNDCRMVPMRLIPDNAETVDLTEAAEADLGMATWAELLETASVLQTAVRAWLDGETP